MAGFHVIVTIATKNNVPLKIMFRDRCDQMGWFPNGTIATEKVERSSRFGVSV